ncbi:MAG: hypothetical protein JXB47_01680 [Anaerolineae bacterium]|nr:hypothetical protein [Anaerolineae bacterium]
MAIPDVIEATITDDRRLVLDGELPPDVPVGRVRIIILPHITIDESYGTNPATAAEILASPLVGFWADRDDIGDPAEYALRMRREAAERRDPWAHWE